MTWLENQVINNTGPKETQQITDLGIEYTFRDAPDNAGEGTKYYLSNTTANPVTQNRRLLLLMYILNSIIRLYAILDF